MKLPSYFDKYLENIEPDKKYKKYAVEAHTRVREHLEESNSSFCKYVSDSYLYGSYARHTAEGDIKDVDIVLITELDPSNEKHKPSLILPQLRAELNKFYSDPKATKPNRKSVQVIDPLPDEKDAHLTLDVIPAVLTNTLDDEILVPDMKEDKWVLSHPKGHLSFTSNLNSEDVSGGMFVPLVKIMKHWWKQHSGWDELKPKGFWIEVLTGQFFGGAKETYAEYFVDTLQNIVNKFSEYETYQEVPELEDPGLKNETLKTSMTLAEFVHFMDAVNDTLLIAQEAIDSDDEDESAYLWRSILGEEFPQSENSSPLDLSKIVDFIESALAPKEQFLQRDFGIPFVQTGYSVKIDGWVTKNKGFRDGSVSSIPLIQKKANLLFKIMQCSVPGNYGVLWKVKNTGKEAARLKVQRGEITWDKGEKQKKESTLYTGSHYVECYVVNENNQCVAWDRIRVRIH